MSADSKSQSSSQPPLSQLWPGFGSTSNELSNPLEHHQHHPTNQTPATSLSMSLPKHHQQPTNINNNYVNFNQFIMQHNLKSPHETKSPLSSSLDDKFAKVEGQNSKYDDVFSFIQNMEGMYNNNNINAKGSNNNAISGSSNVTNNGGSTNTNHQQQQQTQQLKHQQYNVSL